jgi:hypothetical protein
MVHHGRVTSALLSLLHLGALHPVEKGLTLLLAFGPFVVLAVVIAVRRRQDAAAEQQPPVDPATPDAPADPRSTTD